MYVRVYVCRETKSALITIMSLEIDLRQEVTKTKRKPCY